MASPLLGARGSVDGSTRPGAGPARRRSERRFRPDARYAPYWFILPALVALLALIVYPLVRGVVISFYNTNLLDKWDFVGLRYYISELTSATLWSALGRTSVYTFFVVVGNLAVGTGLALLLNGSFRFRTAFRAILILPWLFPEVVVAIVWTWLLNPLYGPTHQLMQLFGYHGGPVEWLNSPTGAMAGVVVASIWKGYPLVLITVLAGLQTISHDLYEAAALDGAGRMRSFWHITLPGLRPVMLVVVILETIWYFKQFTIPWQMTSGGPVDATRLISIDIYSTAFQNFQFGRAGAMAVIVFLIVLAISFVYRRAIRER
jgi:ABC-type sugar transport system permease subunit